MTDHRNEEPEEPQVQGFAVPMGSMRDLVMRAAHAHDRDHMTAETIELQVNNMLDSLNVDQLVGLRRILNADDRSAPNNYFDGMVVAILRLVHRRDVDGKSLAVDDLLTGQDAQKEA